MCTGCLEKDPQRCVTAPQRSVQPRCVKLLQVKVLTQRITHIICKSDEPANYKYHIGRRTRGVKDEGGRRSGEEKSVFAGVSLSCRPPVTFGGGEVTDPAAGKPTRAKSH